mmetsp:Transcript_111189/g.358735  ORF Transcript_111189/g.358735 Transcript_111189/m.358735 type:complete len:250 (+) Transcript_111189:105-854(+)
MDASSTASVSQAPARYGLVRLTLAVRAFPAAGFSESDAAAAAAAVAKAVLALVGPDGVVDARLLAYDAVLFSALRGASQVGGPALEETALEEPAPPEAGLPPLLTTEGDVTSSALVWPCRSSSCCVCSESVLSAFGGYLAGVVAGQPGFPSPVRSSRTSCPHQGWMPNSRDVGRTRWIAGLAHQQQQQSSRTTAAERGPQRVRARDVCARAEPPGDAAAAREIRARTVSAVQLASAPLLASLGPGAFPA